MRLRLGARAFELGGGFAARVLATLVKESGAELRSYEASDYYLRKFLEEAPLRDVLDAITYIARVMPGAGAKVRWIEFARTVFRDESLSYRVDDQGGVHPLVDEEFERSRVATISALARSDLAAVLHAFEQSHHHLESDPPDTKAALRSVFEALETLVRLLDPGTKVLAANDAQRALGPRVDAAHASDPVARDAARLYLKSFQDWINGVHIYRHGQPSEVPVAPPLDLAVALMAAAASYLRWIVGLTR